MPTITDWLMVIITAFYVVATIFIYIANAKSAKATREQLIVSKQQYEETKRISTMPYLQAEKDSGSSDNQLDLALNSNDLRGGDLIYKIKIKNIGNGTAKNIRYKWNNFTESYDRGIFPINALQSGEWQSILIKFKRPIATDGITAASIDLTYEDLLENTYCQRLQFNFNIKGKELMPDNYFMGIPIFNCKGESQCLNNHQQ